MIAKPPLGERPITGHPSPGEEPGTSVPARPGDVRPGDHVAHFYESAAEQAAVAAELLVAAVSRGERGVLLALPEAHGATIAAITGRGVNVEAARARGALLILSSREVCLKDGRFDQERQMRFWEEQVAAARRDGFRGMAVASVMDWALEDAPGAADYLEYEVRAGLTFSLPMSLICQYDRSRFAPEALRALLRSHALLIHQGSVLRNPYAVPLEAALQPEPADRELERLLASIHQSARAEQAVRESEHRLRTVFSAVSSGIIFKGPTGEILDYNPAGEQILGVTRDSATGRPTADPRLGAIHEDGSPYPFQDWPVMISMRTGEPVHNAIMGLTRPDGSVTWVRINSEPLAHPGEKPYAAVVSLDDVTEERRAWMEVRRGEQQLRLAMECAGHAYWEIDVATDRFVAGAPWTLLGHAEADFDGSREKWLALCNPEDAPNVSKLFSAHVQGKTASYRSEYRARAKDGSWRWILASGRAIARDASGQALRMAGTVTDITELKNLEGQLRQSDRLASVGTLAAGVAHEVNNPLAYLTGNLQFVEETLARMDPSTPELGELRSAIEDALDGAGRVKGIVQGLRKFAAPARTIQRVPCDSRRQVEDAVTLVRNEIAARARLRVDLPSGLPQVIAEEHEIAQVLVNLLVNAAQAIPEGRASENEVSIGAEVRAGHLAITVRDTGSGIAPSDLPRIFDPFFTTKPVGSGTGLGLSICHGIVTSLGGRIEVESTLGRGSAFRVLLPVAAEIGARPRAPERAAPETPRARVLVIDDEPFIGKCMARLLSPSHDVTTLTSPAEALRRARAGESWDVVLCDLMMPEMSGMDLEAALIQARPDLVPRILYLTGGAFTERSKAFLNSGRPYLDKPVAPAELHAAMAHLVNRAGKRELNEAKNPPARLPSRAG